MNKTIFEESNIKIFFSTHVHKTKNFKLIFTFLIIKIFFKKKKILKSTLNLFLEKILKKII